VPFSIEFRGLKELRAKLGPDLYAPEVRKAIEASLVDIEQTAKRLAPRDTGALRASITHKLGRAPLAGGFGWVGSRLPYAAVVHNGRRPGSRPPPSGAIAAWLGRRGGDPRLAFVVARAIGRRGTRPRPFLTDALARSRGKIDKHLADAGRAIQRKWERK
jgi:hypothetical protein